MMNYPDAFLRFSWEKLRSSSMKMDENGENIDLKFEMFLVLFSFFFAMIFGVRLRVRSRGFTHHEAFSQRFTGMKTW
jgi:hypothetical protein